MPPLCTTTSQASEAAHLCPLQLAAVGATRWLAASAGSLHITAYETRPEPTNLPRAAHAKGTHMPLAGCMVLFA